MYFTILDDATNAVDTFTDEGEAVAALSRIVGADPDAAEHLLLLRYDDDGSPVGEAQEARVVAPASVLSPTSQMTVVAWRGFRPAVTVALLATQGQTCYLAAGVWGGVQSPAPRTLAG